VLAVLTTHPIQYQVPVWKGLAARKNIPFKVIYMSNQGLEARFDPGFGKSLSWDIDLLSGYESELLDTYRGQRLDSFWSLRLKRGFRSTLRGMGAEVLWIQGWQVAAYWQAVLEARQAGTEVWLRGETNTRSNAGRVGRQFRRRLLRQLLRRIDRFLYIGEANRHFYLEQGVNHEQLAAAPYCVDNVRFIAAAAAARPERDRIREEWGIPAEAFCFLFAGKFLAQKRPFDLILAARRLQHRQGKRIHLLWVGTGELGGELREACDLCFDAGTKKPVDATICSGPSASFVGFLNQSQISRAYVAADCLVLPSNARETWGLVVNEAMACGLPCVVSDACGCAEDLVTPIQPDLCYPVGDITALERAMAVAITNTPPLQLLRAHISKYDVTQTIDTVEALYFKALGRRQNEAQTGNRSTFAPSATSAL
jgi:glycosyltransferase involved in cell wall biosynthesis